MKTIYNTKTGALTTASDEDAAEMVKWCGYQWNNPLGPKEAKPAEVAVKAPKQDPQPAVKELK